MTRAGELRNLADAAGGAAGAAGPSTVPEAGASSPSSALDPEHVRFVYAGVFLVSTAVLLLQISLTRIFSFSLWYHFAYVTISVALLGYGASGSFLAVFPGLAGTPPTRRLAFYATACGLAIVVAYVVCATVPFHPFYMTREPGRQIPFMVVYYVAVTAPFFLAGLCISVALKTLSQHVSRLYFFDLVGAGFGCLIVVFVVAGLTTPGAVIVAAIIVSLAGVMFGSASGARGMTVPAVGTVLVAVSGIAALFSVQIGPSPDKFLYPFARDHVNVRQYGHHWSPIFRTDVFALTNEEFTRTFSYANWGISPFWKANAATRAPKLRMVTHDGDAGAVIYNFDGDLDKLEMFDHLILKAPYVLLKQPNVLVIGVGGGTDIVNAIKNGATHITGVELDPFTVKVVKVDQADFAGHIYDRPDVTMIAGEGRSTVRHSDARYDLIELTGVDTLAALSTGAYVLSESYLYTTEAISEFLDHLTPNGILSVIVADLTERNGFPRHTIRLVSLVMEALHRRGIEDVEGRVAVLASTEEAPQVAVLTKNSPMTADDVQQLQTFADSMGFQIWALPGKTLPSVHSQYLRTRREERAAFLGRYPLTLTATSDDNPFFFNFYQWRNLGKSLSEVDLGHTLATAQIILALILVFSIVFSAVLILLPLLVFQRQGLHTEGKWGFIAFFLGIGLGYIFIEISCIQKFVLFLGYPTYSLTVVLFSLLTYSGVGSFLTGRMQRPPEERLLPLFGGLALLSLLYLAVIPSLFQAFLGSAFPLRVVVASAVLIPLGLVMGMFFPTGIQIIRRRNESFVPWAWGVNGCASVVATVLAVVLAMTYGFRVVTVLAVTVYLIGVLGMRASIRRAPAL